MGIEDKVDAVHHFAEQSTLIAAEEFALSMVPLLIAVNEVGGIAAAIKILRTAKKEK